ncbi:exported protein of unknown function [Candidatus Nitrosotalea okcheonensis]|uniref:Hemolysin-type calcium-binding region n=1 Tax=Candidatus Nitrosotalea okcheonensis TaxID=1903276 RepID=A0A2H1FEY7_9ARCH|nr:exported protein of unknown function [Candidatus Nitrosotalea okcheonensis]
MYCLNHRNYFICSIILLALIIVQIDQAAAVTVKSTVLIIPTLCKGHIDHLDHMFFATRNDEKLKGTDQNDLMVGFENTLIFGKGGDDCLVGGHGNNALMGGHDNNVILGGSGINIIFVGNGNNVIVGGPTNDVIFFGKGNNIIDGGTGQNYCIGKINHSIIVNCTVVSQHEHHDEKPSKDDIKNIILNFISGNNLPNSDGKPNNIPSWIKKDLSWWENDSISNDDLTSLLHYFFDNQHYKNDNHHDNKSK